MKLSCGTDQSALSVFAGVSLFVSRTAEIAKRRKSGAEDAANGWRFMKKV
jgi:hypothetical protein